MTRRSALSFGEVFPLQDDGETLGHCRLPFGIGNPLRRGVGPAGLFAAQLVPLSEHGERPGVVALSPEDSAKIEVGHGVVGLESNRFAVGGDDLVQFPLGLQGEDEGGVVLERGSGSIWIASR